MGRRKTYDRDALIDKAVTIFRENGFAGTSAEMLSDRLGVNRFGIYSEFGSKQGLFDAALDRYRMDYVDARFGPLDTDAAGLREIRSIFEYYGTASDGPAYGRGCLLCNTAVEFGPEEPGEGDFVQTYFARITKAFTTALENARERGELFLEIDPSKEAAFLTSAVLGLFVMLRAHAPAAQISNAAAMAVDHLDRLKR